MINSFGFCMTPSSVAQQRFSVALMAMSLAVIVLTVFFPAVSNLLPQLPLLVPTSGHGHVYLHGHSFIDARNFFGIPNGLDVLSNLPFFVGGICGLLVLHRAKQMVAPLQSAARIFFMGLILTCFGSSFYHWAPSDVGLMMDRLGMAVAFAGVISFAAGSRLGCAVATQATLVLLILAPLAAIAAHSLHNVLPWAVVQFGGMAMIMWLATLPERDGQRLNLWALIAWYILAKLLEAQDEAVFWLTQGVVSGHTLKHLAACMAAWPVIATLKKS
jgi:hypothetical protein